MRESRRTYVNRAAKNPSSAKIATFADLVIDFAHSFRSQCLFKIYIYIFDCVWPIRGVVIVLYRYTFAKKRMSGCDEIRKMVKYSFCYQETIKKVYAQCEIKRIMFFFYIFDIYILIYSTLHLRYFYLLIKIGPNRKLNFRTKYLNFSILQMSKLYITTNICKNKNTYFWELY